MKRRVDYRSKIPRVEHVVFIDVETTDKIYSFKETMPYILEFSASYGMRDSFDRYVWPKDQKFKINL